MSSEAGESNSQNPVPNCGREFLDRVVYVSFYVLLAVHFSIILFNDQYDAKFFFVYVYFSLYLANSLAATISAPALYRLVTFQVPSNMSLFLLRLRDTSSRNTPPPGDPSGGVVYLRIVLFPEEASLFMGNS